MKILILQLARLGDILQTWPTLRALKRQFPQAQLHVLARTRFREALDGLSVVDQVWSFDSKEILRPLAQTEPDIDASLSAIELLIGQLRAEQFDQVINLSFSPVSSFLTSLLAAGSGEEFSAKFAAESAGDSMRESTSLRGYTRQADGYLAIPDDASAYFYAQVGQDRPNRIHLTDLFAHIAGVELAPEDWAGPELDQSAQYQNCEGAIVVHIGASQAQKTLSGRMWAEIVKGIVGAQVAPVVLIGAASEREIGENITAACGGAQPINLVGQTKFSDLFPIISRAHLLVGGDSAPLHIASLVGTAVFNLSFPMVSFWETGPRAARSRVISVTDETLLPCDVCVQDIVSVWREVADACQSRTFITARTHLPSYLVETTGSGYSLSSSAVASDFPCDQYEFQWNFVRAIYMGESFPPAPSEIFVEAVRRLLEANAVALHQLKSMDKLSHRETSVQILDRVDEIIEQIARMVPDIGPLVRWFQTERLRMGPMPVAELISETRRLHLKLEEVLALYHLEIDQFGTDMKSEREKQA